MRICRFRADGLTSIGFYFDDFVVDLARLAGEISATVTHGPTADLLQFLPPDGPSWQGAMACYEQFQRLPAAHQQRLSTAVDRVQLLVPLPNPPKVLLLAGNYAAHVEEGGGRAEERQNTFPYFFWKPPSTTLTNPGDPIRIPAASPDHVDWELELGVIIGRRCRAVTEDEALRYVAGYTVCNDVSDRGFRINPGRKKRDRDAFFDWLHGKWHDTFLPMGPCVRSADSVADPQQFPLRLRLNGREMQNASTGLMIFSVSARISILSNLMTLEPGDVISTGTPAGVGHARKPPVYLKVGDDIEAEISGIGLLRNPVVGPE